MTFTFNEKTYPVYNFSNTYRGLEISFLGTAFIVISSLLGNPAFRALSRIYGYSPFKSVTRLRGEDSRTRGENSAKIIVVATTITVVLNFVAYFVSWPSLAASVPPLFQPWVIDVGVRVGLVLFVLTMDILAALALVFFLGRVLTDVLYWVVFVKRRHRYDKKLFQLQNRLFVESITKLPSVLIISISVIIGGLILPAYGVIASAEAIVFPFSVLAGTLLFRSLERACREVGFDIPRGFVKGVRAAAPEVMAAFWEFMALGAIAILSLPQALSIGYELAQRGLVMGILSPFGSQDFFGIFALQTSQSLELLRGILIAGLATLFFGIALYIYVLPTLFGKMTWQRKLYRLLVPAITFVVTFVSEQAINFVSNGVFPVSIPGLITAGFASGLVAFLGSVYTR